ncbi:MAG: HDOD domain-containing protein [Planctomycetes bacterium]|nr:HDOD domain-containing protein [Planctomycetota bacterium]MBU2458273.1 HDOD domain-containing protein [Planctomycetota bacterium]MBU2596241.1 HDOD domain-containing protein [Planctomycetota bacterium]
MTSTLANVSVRRITLALHQLDWPRVHPDSTVRCIKSIINNKSGLGILLETDPAAAVAVINLCRQSNIELSFENLSFQQLINGIPTHKLLKTFFSLKTFDIENLYSQLPIAQINTSSAGRAFAARLIAGKTGQANESLAFLAGLLADIGLLALVELFPKSLSAILEESKGDNAAVLRLEKENLGITHNAVSRQLAQKWRLPQAVADSVWLYCIGEADKLNNLGNSGIILTVRLADMLVKSITSGSESIAIPARLSLNAEDINEIKDKLRSFIYEINAAMQAPQKFDSEAVKQVCISLLEESAEEKFTDFLAAVSSSLSPASSATDIAGTICSLICRILKAEKAGIALTDNGQYETVTASGDKLEFSVFDNAPSAIEAGFEAQSTKSVKLEIAGSTIGSMFLQIPAEGPLANASFLNNMTAFISQLIAIKLAAQHDQEIAQAVVDYAQTPEQLPRQSAAPQPRNDLSEIIAEIAAGAAHELNNPLTVISGRAQLLGQRETDEAKKEILNQIVEKIKDAHEIIGQLMSYARPARPQTRAVSPFIMVNNCLEKITARYMSEPLEIHLENIENLSDIEVDPEQVAEAIAQIIYNSLESYESGNGPVQISGSEQKEQNLIEISIKDIGCGMSDETLKKAVEPFFSDKSAGRQRGMGLSIASSLLKNNNCSMSIQSELDKGTTVTITLPKAD